MGNQLCCQDGHQRPGQLQQLEDNLQTKKVTNHKQIEEIKEEKQQESEPLEQKRQIQNPLQQFIHQQQQNHQHNQPHSHQHHQHHDHQHHQHHDHQHHQHHDHQHPQQSQQNHQHVQQQHQNIHKVQEVFHPVEEKIQVPSLSQKTNQTIQRHHFFQSQLSSITNPHNRKYGQDVYVGQLDEQKVRPNGLGKMYKQDGSIYIGHFNNGKAHGKGAFIFKNGSYYQGQFQNNKAETTEGFAQYNSQHLKYTGGFKDNTFHGFGKEEGDNHAFQGHYQNGKRLDGTLSWKAVDGDYQYQGPFNDKNKFHGKGTLIEPKGVYKGQFVEGKKHGQGQYKQKNGSKYVGSYFQNEKSGFGTIYNADNTIAYKGQLKNGLPHGKGIVTEDNGKIVEVNWIQGIDSSFIQS